MEYSQELQKDLQKAANVYKELKTIANSVNINQDGLTMSDCLKLVANMVNDLYDFVDGKVETECIESSKSVKAIGSVNGYFIKSPFCQNLYIEPDFHTYYEIKNLHLLINELTFAYWRTTLNREEFELLELLDKIENM